MAKLLYDDTLAPITSELGFVENACEIVATEFYQWQVQIQSRYEGRYLEIQDVVGENLKAIIEYLLPLRRGDHTKHLFVPTRSKRWTACFDNGWQGGDTTTVVSLLAERLGCRGVRAVWIPNTVQRDSDRDRGWKGRYGAVVFDVFGPLPEGPLNYIRTVELINDGQWDFITGGTPFEFEQTERYNFPRKVDRFDPDMLECYLKHLGINAFDEDSYVATEDEPARLVSLKGNLGYKVQEYSLEDVRRDY